MQRTSLTDAFVALRRLNIVAEVTGFGDREFYKARALLQLSLPVVGCS